MIGHPKPASVPRTCAVCGQPRFRKNKRFCSLRCHGARLRKARPLCPVCKTQPVAKWKGAKTCGAACGYEYRRAQQGPVACRGCGTTYRPYPSALRRGRGYCSLACFYATDGRAKYDEALCAECGVPFTRRPANMRQSRLKFCSQACARSFFRGVRSPAWRGGSNPNRGSGWLRIAEETRARDEYRCRRCGKSQEGNGQRLSVDHLIPWRVFTSAEEANQPENLVSLCRSCHTKKTQIAERHWLKGDVLAMQRHVEAITRESVVR